MPAPVLTVAQMRAWEQATWASGQTPGEVIRRVGERLAARARRLTHPTDSILILAGQGHNGDDARCAAPHLADRSVAVLNIASPADDRAAVQAALERRPALVLDGLFGIGLNRALSADWIALIETVNASRARVLAVDVPSGINADTGESFGAVIGATVTLTVGAPKAGLLQARAWAAVGRLEVEPDVGLVPCPFQSDMRWTMPGDFADYPPGRPVAAHKGSFGHLAIVAGSEGYHGAAVLAARGAQRAQPGLITLFTSPATYIPVASQLQSVMVQPWRPGASWPAALSVFLCGPGLAAPDLPGEVRDAVLRWWRESPRPVVVDASALDWLKNVSAAPEALRVLTPHPGEAARLLGVPVAEVQADRPAALRQLSARFGGSWVVLKGHQTLVGRATGPIFVNSSGNSRLAQGGSGDLLAGYLAGLLAQSALEADPGLALRYAVWQHGAAADRLTEARSNWTIEDLAGELGG